MSLETRILKKVMTNYIPGVVERSLRRQSRTIAFAAGGIGILLAGRSLLRRLREYDLQGKTVLVTGGSRGLGLVIARECVNQGARVAICARNEQELEQARQDLLQRGGDVIAIACDLTDQEGVNRMVRTVQNQFGAVDVLINNAGIITAGPAEEMTLADYEAAMKTNYWAALYTTFAVLQEMRSRREGRIVNIASIAGKEGNPNAVPYSAAKSGVIGLTKAVAKEVATKGVLVNAITPAVIATEILSQLTDEHIKYMTSRIPMGRVGQPEEVAALAAFLSSDELTFSTGAVFDLSGGRATY